MNHDYQQTEFSKTITDRRFYRHYCYMRKPFVQFYLPWYGRVLSIRNH